MVGASDRAPGLYLDLISPDWLICACAEEGHMWTRAGPGSGGLRPVLARLAQQARAVCTAAATIYVLTDPALASLVTTHLCLRYSSDQGHSTAES